MTWAEAKTEISTLLGGDGDSILPVSITSPVAMSIKKVYANPPGAVTDFPCFIIYPPRVEVARGVSRRDKTYTVRCLLLVQDADLARAAELLDAFREATVNVFDDAVALHGKASSVIGQVIEAAALFEYGGVKRAGFDCLLTISLAEGATFAP